MSYCTKSDQVIKILEGQFAGMTGIVIYCDSQTGSARVLMSNGTEIILIPPTCYDYEVVVDDQK